VPTTKIYFKGPFEKAGPYFVKKPEYIVVYTGMGLQMCLRKAPDSARLIQAFRLKGTFSKKARRNPDFWSGFLH
jgi:hypothetical protein